METRKKHDFITKLLHSLKNDIESILTRVQTEQLSQERLESLLEDLNVFSTTLSSYCTPTANNVQPVQDQVASSNAVTGPSAVPDPQVEPGNEVLDSSNQSDFNSNEARDISDGSSDAINQSLLSPRTCIDLTSPIPQSKVSPRAPSMGSEYETSPRPSTIADKASSTKPCSDHSEGAEFADDDEFDDFDALLDETVLMELDNVCSQDGLPLDNDSMMSEGRDDVVVLGDNTHSPADDTHTPVDDTHTPADDTHTPVDDTYSPVDPSVLDCPPPFKEHIDKLKQSFGHSKFKPEQWRIIYSILYEKRDNCSVMATGFGKSLCYQYPAVFTKGLSIVVSPLISLMEDQVAQLNVKNIPACFLGSAQADSQTYQTKVLSGEIQLLYVTPEFVSGSGTAFLTKLANSSLNIIVIAIDEAHCVSQWGHDFRESYRKLDTIRYLLPNIPILAVTATATPTVKRDICKSLCLKSPLKISTSFDRPNLYIEINPKGVRPDLDFKRLLVASKAPSGRVVYSFEGPTIVYCRTKAVTNEVTTVLTNMGVSCAAYHADLPTTTRTAVHHKFLRDELQCVVATIAFGMGIDKPDVRLIVHYSAPQDIECYYQEIGRAGRDGFPSKCYMFYSSKDYNTCRFFLRDLTDLNFREHKESMLRKLINFVSSSECRRRVLLRHFDKDVALDTIGGHDRCCDNCRRKLSGIATGSAQSTESTKTRNYSEQAQMLLQIIKDLNGKYGLGVPVLVLRGSNSKKLTSDMMRNRLHGRGMAWSEKWWKSFGGCLISGGYLQEKSRPGNYGSVVQLTKKGEKWLYGALSSPSLSLTVTPTNEMLALERFATQQKSQIPSSANPHNMSPVQATPLSPPSGTTSLILPLTEDPSAYETVMVDMTIPHSPLVKDSNIDQLEKMLYQDLIAYRGIVASDMDIPPFYVASNKLLGDLALNRPSSKTTLAKVEGVSEQWLVQFGERFLQRIALFTREHPQLALDTFADEADGADGVVIQVAIKKRSRIISPLSSTVLTDYTEFQINNKTVDAIAKERCLKASTVFDHLVTALELGYEVNYRRAGLTAQLEDLITTTIRKPPICSNITQLRPIKDQLPEHIEFWQIKMAVAILLVTTGFVRPAMAEAECLRQSVDASPSLPKTDAFSVPLLQKTPSGGCSSGGKRKLPSTFKKSYSKGLSYKKKKTFF